MLSVSVSFFIHRLSAHSNQGQLFHWDPQPAGLILATGHGP